MKSYKALEIIKNKLENDDCPYDDLYVKEAYNIIVKQIFTDYRGSMYNSYKINGDIRNLKMK